jgi:predicted nucleic acid-binding protein
MNLFIVDASVVAKWYLPDEILKDTAQNILDDYAQAKINIAMPQLTLIELINTLIMSYRRNRANKIIVDNSVNSFLSLGINLKETNHLSTNILNYCYKYNCTAYDATYLALAESLNCKLITADKKLYNQTKSDFRWILWLGDY